MSNSLLRSTPSCATSDSALPVSRLLKGGAHTALVVGDLVFFGIEFHVEPNTGSSWVITVKREALNTLTATIGHHTVVL